MKIPSFLFQKLSEKELKTLYKWLRDSRVVMPTEGYPDVQLEQAMYDVLGIDLSTQEKYPRFSRQCSYCKFLGNYIGASLYYCTDPKYKGVYVQIKHERHFDGLVTDLSEPEHPLVIKAWQLAKERGFIK
jgi:hypothetical protein